IDSDCTKNTAARTAIAAENAMAAPLASGRLGSSTDSSVSAGLSGSGTISELVELTEVLPEPETGGARYPDPVAIRLGRRSQHPLADPDRAEMVLHAPAVVQAGHDVHVEMRPAAA